MKLEKEKFYRILAPRPAVLITTADKKGRSNAAPFSFVMPVSSNPPLVAFASAPQRHTLANIRETREFVINMSSENILNKLWICSEKFPKGVSEIEKASFTKTKSTMVSVPKIEESFGWLECILEFEKEAGDHVIVIGRIVDVEVKDIFWREEKLDVPKAKPLLHVTGKDFVVAERVVSVD
ncbi:flavin reductase family protein [Candidatus Oleimmundimicrobium sp.]|uniref:flavin reductase family protein n=1 Tax=Candidatus Oleimmundimicrobium sp. TaxID=3060597 RepID=UPI002727248D|nr:flavin reductase family protein [Candidatus Oleimmundimicrobium sp.]MDO8886105.1 flavin reductase family protein [Candidatus Oleimmundimicrobium sp.]